jgi:flagellar basal body P-ring formation protein FlgA
MRESVILFIILVGAGCQHAIAADPVTISLRESASTSSAVITLNTIAELTGGDPKLRAVIATIDVGDRPKNGSSLPIAKRHVEFRLKLAGYSNGDFSILGADRVMVSAVRTPVATERVVRVATEELRRRLGPQTESLAIDLVQPVAATMPEIAPDDDIEIAATPQVAAVRMGRTQMNVTIRVNGEKRLTFPVFLNSNQKVIPNSAITQITPVTILKPLNDTTVIKAQQRVTMQVKLGDLVVSAQGDALQDGKIGQRIRVLNIDSKKMVVGTVNGPGTIEVDLTGGRP